MTGTVLNVIAVLIGGSIGTVLGNRLPAKVQETVLHGLGPGVLLSVGTVALVQGGLSALAMGVGSVSGISF